MAHDLNHEHEHERSHDDRAHGHSHAAPRAAAAPRQGRDHDQGLADVPPELEWFANIDNKSTRRAYENALQDFMRFTGIKQPGEFRIVTRSHVIAWRDDLVGRGLSRMTVRHRLGLPLPHIFSSDRTV